MSKDAALLEPDAENLATLYDDYLEQRELAAYANPAGTRSLPEFYAPVPTPMTMVVRD